MKMRLLAPAVALGFVLAEGSEFTSVGLPESAVRHHPSFIALTSDRFFPPHTHMEGLEEVAPSVSSPLSASGSQQDSDVYVLQLKPVFATGSDETVVLESVDLIAVPRFSPGTQQMYRRCSIEEALALLVDRCGFSEAARETIRDSLARGELNEVGGRMSAATRIFHVETLRDFGLTFRPA
jgi:hypothetical protein